MSVTGRIQRPASQEFFHDAIFDALYFLALDAIVIIKIIAAQRRAVEILLRGIAGNRKPRGQHGSILH